MQIKKVIQSLGVIYVCVSGAHEKPRFFLHKDGLIEPIEQSRWEAAHRATTKKLLVPGDLHPVLKKKIMDIVGALPQVLETRKKLPSCGQKRVRYIPIRKKIC